MPSSFHRSSPCLLPARSRRLTVFGLALLSAASCQGSGQVRVAFDNRGATPTAAAGDATVRSAALTTAEGITPDVFGIKLTAIYLAEDIDAGTSDNAGHVARIWTNPVCDPELHACGISPGAGAYQVKDYFDLALPTEQVNAALNSQLAELKPGTYRYLRVSLVGIEQPPGQTTPDLRFGNSTGTINEVRFRSNAYTVALDPAMEVADGDQLQVTLNYNVQGSYFTGPTVNANIPPDGVPHSDWYCSDSTASPAGGCLNFTGFSPAVSKL